MVLTHKRIPHHTREAPEGEPGAVRGRRRGGGLFLAPITEVLGIFSMIMAKKAALFNPIELIFEYTKILKREIKNEKNSATSVNIGKI